MTAYEVGLIAGEITTTEIIPMLIGLYIGYKVLNYFRNRKQKKIK